MSMIDRHQKERDIDFVERNEPAHNYMARSSVLNVKERKDSMKAAGNRQLPFKELLQIMKAYSSFMANGRIKIENI